MLQDTRLAIIVNPELTPGHLANTIAAICIGIGSAMPGLGNQRLTDSRQNTIDISSNRPVPILQADGATIRALLLKALPKEDHRVVVPFPIACGACGACRAKAYSLCENSNPNAWIAEKMLGHSPAGIFGYSHLTGGFAGAAHVFAGLLEFTAQFRHACLVFRALGALLKFVEVSQHSLLFFLETLELAAEFFALGLGLGFLKGRLKFLEPLIEILLAAGEFLKAIEDLEVFAALGGGGRLGLSLGLVTIVVPGQFELVERIRLGAPLNEPDSSSFYWDGAEGYVDYPTWQQAQAA